jgi:hypothetical protein
VPPDVTTGRVVVVVGGEVVGVVVVGGEVVGVLVVGCEVVGVLVVGCEVVVDPAADSVVGVVVAVDEVDVGSVVEVDTEVPVEVDGDELAPGCSLATMTPMSAVAPAEATIAARVRYRTSAFARRRPSGELWLRGWLIEGIGSVSSAHVHSRTRESHQPQRTLWAVCEVNAAKPASYSKPK